MCSSELARVGRRVLVIAVHRRRIAVAVRVAAVVGPAAGREQERGDQEHRGELSAVGDEPRCFKVAETAATLPERMR